MTEMTYIKTHEELLEDAYLGIVGLSEDLEVYGGYDEFYGEAAALNDKTALMLDDDLKYMSANEKRKLADVMIARWTKYKKVAV